MDPKTKLTVKNHDTALPQLFLMDRLRVHERGVEKRARLCSQIETYHAVIRLYLFQRAKHAALVPRWTHVMRHWSEVEDEISHQWSSTICPPRH